LLRRGVLEHVLRHARDGERRVERHPGSGRGVVRPDLEGVDIGRQAGCGDSLRPCAIPVIVPSR
jgi:hypothetical protein